MSSIVWPVSRPRDACSLLPHYCWLSAVYDCAIGDRSFPVAASCTWDSLSQRVGTLYVCFSSTPQGFPLQAFLPMTLLELFSACTVTVVIFGHLSHSFILTYLVINDCLAMGTCTINKSATWESCKPSPIRQGKLDCCMRALFLFCVMLPSQNPAWYTEYLWSG